MPAFFVPMVDADKQEEAYNEIAQFVGAGAHAPGKRIYSMTWKHDGVVWTATVGETLRGTETKIIGRGRAATYREVPRSTSATVLAICSGFPYLIAHDNKSRYWNLPILAGEPSRTVLFDA